MCGGHGPGQALPSGTATQLCAEQPPCAGLRAVQEDGSEAQDRSTSEGTGTAAQHEKRATRGPWRWQCSLSPTPPPCCVSPGQAGGMVQSRRAFLTWPVPSATLTTLCLSGLQRRRGRHSGARSGPGWCWPPGGGSGTSAQPEFRVVCHLCLCLIAILCTGKVASCRKACSEVGDHLAWPCSC